MTIAVQNGLLDPIANYELPTEFGMFDAKGNAKIRMAFEKFIAAAKTESVELTTFEARLKAFQNDDVETEEGNDWNEFFGYDDRFDKK